MINLGPLRTRSNNGSWRGDSLTAAPPFEPPLAQPEVLRHRSGFGQQLVSAVYRGAWARQTALLIQGEPSEQVLRQANDVWVPEHARLLRHSRFLRCQRNGEERQ